MALQYQLIGGAGRAAAGIADELRAGLQDELVRHAGVAAECHRRRAALDDAGIAHDPGAFNGVGAALDRGTGRVRHVERRRRNAGRIALNRTTGQIVHGRLAARLDGDAAGCERLNRL